MDVFLKEKRKNLGYNLKTVSDKTGIDTGLLSKYESGQRMPSKKHLELLQKFYNIQDEEIKKEFFIKKISDLLKDENYGFSVLHEAEKRIRASIDQHRLHIHQIPKGMGEQINQLEGIRQIWFKMQDLQPEKAVQAENHFQLQALHNWCHSQSIILNISELEGFMFHGKVYDRLHIDHWIQVKYLLDTFRFMLSNSPLQELNWEAMLHIYFELHKNTRIKDTEVFRSRNSPEFANMPQLPPAEVCEYSLRSYFGLYQAEKNQSHPLLWAAELCERIISLHPFEKNNSLMLNILLSYLLRYHGFNWGRLDFRKLYNAMHTLDDESWRTMILTDLISDQKNSFTFLLKWVGT